MPPEVTLQGHLDLITLAFFFDAVLSSLLPSDSENEDAKGEMLAWFRSDTCRRLLLVGVFSKVEFATPWLNSVLDLVLRVFGWVGLSTSLSLELFFRSFLVVLLASVVAGDFELLLLSGIIFHVDPGECT